MSALLRSRDLRRSDSFGDGLVVGFNGVVGFLAAVSAVIGVVPPFPPAAIIVPICLGRKHRETGTPAAASGPATPLPAEAPKS